MVNCTEELPGFRQIAARASVKTMTNNNNDLFVKRGFYKQR
ncbi:MAG: hypothetical protein NTX61_05940 [Bacteroidetes bacterium]|nr:hypothetical protein [Bacteroidota bacterium]